MFRVLVLVLILFGLLWLWAGWMGCAVALPFIATALAYAWETHHRASTPTLPAEVLDPAVRAKVGEATRPGKQGDEGIAEREGLRRQG
jgi:hypothetical protein